MRNLEIGPLSIRGILDHGLTLLGRHLWHVILLIGCVWSPVVFYLIWIAVAHPDVMVADFGPNSLEEDAIPPDHNLVQIKDFLTGILGYILQSALVFRLAYAYLGDEATIAQALGRGILRLLPLIWTMIFVFIIVIVGLVFFFVPGIYFALRYAPIIPVVALEGVSGLRALSRCRELMSTGRDYGHALLIYLVWIVGLMGLTMVPLQFIQEPLLWSISFELCVASSLGLLAALTVPLYFSCRSRTEGFDVKLQAKMLGEGGDSEA